MGHMEKGQQKFLSREKSSLKSENGRGTGGVKTNV